MRPPTAKLTFAESCSERKAPETRSDSVSLPVWIVPAGRTTFCACSAAISAARSMPRLASSFIENSTKIRSSCAPRISIFETSGTFKQLGAHVLDIVAQLAMREAVGGEAVDDAERVAELVVEARADDAGRQGVPHVADALADVIPDVRHLLRRGAALQIDEDRGDAGAS